MDRSENITELAKALAKAQAEFEPAKRSKENPMFHSKYATLDDVLASVVGVLAKYNLCVVQPLTTSDTGFVLETMLIHSSGEWISSKSSIPRMDAPSKATNALQVFGISLTYMRRYMLSSLLGISTEDDDDGNAPKQQSGASTQKASVSTTQQNSNLATDKQKNAIVAMLKKLGAQNVNKQLNDQGYPNIDKITKKQASELFERLQKAIAAKEGNPAETKETQEPPEGLDEISETESPF